MVTLCERKGRQHCWREVEDCGGKERCKYGVDLDLLCVGGGKGMWGKWERGCGHVLIFAVGEMFEGGARCRG